MILKLLLCLLAVFFGASSFAQWDWVDNSQASANFEIVTDLAVDDTRDVVYSVGYISGIPNFQEISNTAYAGGEDGFIMKYDLNGNVLWAFPIGGTGDDQISGVAVDEATGNIFVTGFVTGDFGTNGTSLAGVSVGVSANVTGTLGGEDAFVAMYNDMGQLVWYKLIGGTGLDRGMDITVNATAVFVNGIYTNSATLSAVPSIIPTNGSVNNFVAALDKTNGNTIWDAVRGSGMNDYDFPNNNYEIARTGIASDANGVYLVDYFRGLNYRVYNSFDALAITFTDPNSSQNDFVVTSYSNIGNHNWSAFYDNDNNEGYGLDIAVDCEGVYLSSSMHTSGVTPSGVVVSSAHDNFLLSKLNKTNGSEEWVKEFQSTYNHDDYFVGIDADGHGNLYATGRLRGTTASLGTDFNHSGGQTYSEVIIAHFHTDGTFQNFEVFSGTSYAWGMSIGTYKNEKYVIGGYYNGSLTLGGLNTDDNLDNAFVAIKDLAPPITYSSGAGSNSFCQDETDPTPTLNAPAGGTFSGPVEVVFANTSTGEIDLDNSTPGGPYTITYSGFPFTCVAASYETQIYIVQNDDPSFTYGTSNFCLNEPNPFPVSIATSGGNFSTSSSLDVNVMSGEVNMATAVPGGPYYIVYTTSGPSCPATDSIAVYVESVPDPTFSYALSNYCSGDGNVLPNSVTTAGGIFSSSAGLVFQDTNTGEIDLTASTSGATYAIQYLVSNTYCEDSMTFNVMILPDDDASFSYSASIFCNSETNPFPTSVATPGGTFSSSSGLILASTSTGEIDVSASSTGNPYYVAYTTNGAMCPSSDSVAITIEAAPDAGFMYAQNAYCVGSGTVLPSSIVTSGGTFSAPAGIVFVNSTTGEINLDTSTVGGPYTIQYTVFTTNCQQSETFDLTINGTDDPSFTFPANNFCKNEPNPLPSSITTPGGTFSGPTELVVNASTGEIDVISSTVGGPYYLVYTISNVNCPSSDSIEVYIENPPDPSFAYAQSSYCEGRGTLVPSSVVTPGGTFSGPSEIVFTNTTTGEIDIGASTVGGPYTIEYLVSNTYCQKSFTFDLTIVDQDELTSMQYQASAFCVSDGNQVPEIDGLIGGTFSAPNEVDLMNSTTGEINPASSSVGGPYIIRYVTPGACPDSTDFSISINDSLSANTGKDQVLQFVFSSSIEADIPVNGSGEWFSTSSAVVSNPFDAVTNVTDLAIGKNTFIWKVEDGVCPAASDELIIEVEDLFIPQAVTPNDDGKNDYFELYSLDEVTCSIQIFNRWGQVVYENENYQNEWYGQNANGEQLENDTYFYVISIDDSLNYNGYVVLKK